MNIEIMFTIISIALQVAVIWYGWKMLRVAHFLNTWKMGWIHFVIASIIIALRRVLWGMEYFTEAAVPGVVESLLTIFVSMCMLWFVSAMRTVFAEAYQKKIEIGGIPILTEDETHIIRIDLLQQYVDLELRVKKIEGKNEVNHPCREEHVHIENSMLNAVDESKKKKK
jgi:hypothetical protein